MADSTAIIRRLQSLKGMRSPHEAGWRECLQFSFPERAHGLTGTIVTPEDAQSQKNRILDDTAADSARILAASLVSGTTPANSIWFGLDGNDKLGDEEDSRDDEIDRWLDESAKFIFTNIHQANFDAAAYECSVDMAAVGWFVLYIDEAEGGGYQFEQWPIGQCFVSSSRPGGLIDTIYRELELTAEQLVAEYGLDKVSSQVRQAFENEKYDQKFAICQAIYPRKVHMVGARMARNLPFASCHVEVATKHILRESGYHEFPCVVPRWMLTPGTSYATGPMSQALGSIRTVNDIKAMELANLDMAMSGMYVAEDDGVLNPRSIKIGPRKIIVANSVDSIKNLPTGGDFNVSFTAEDRLQAQIRKCMLADQLQPQDGPAMTATEVHVRVGLIRQLLGPIYGRLQAEYLQPLVERCFGLAYRAGVLGQPPEGLRDYSVRYVSPLARAQRLEEVSAMDRLETALLAESQVDPAVLDNYDLDSAVRVRADALGVPKSIIRKVSDVKTIRNKRAKAQQDAQKQAQQAQFQQDAGAEMAKRVAAQ